MPELFVQVLFYFPFRRKWNSSLESNFLIFFSSSTENKKFEQFNQVENSTVCVIIIVSTNENCGKVVSQYTCAPLPQEKKIEITDQTKKQETFQIISSL